MEQLYRVIQDINLFGLETEVSKYLAEGWTCAGGLVIFTRGGEFHVYQQAIQRQPTQSP